MAFARQVSQGEAVDVVAPVSNVNLTLNTIEIKKAELYCIEGWTGFAMDDIAKTQADRGLALDVSQSVYAVAVPAGVGEDVGGYLGWTNEAVFQYGGTHLVDVADPNADHAVAKVVKARNSNGYAWVKLVLV